MKLVCRLLLSAIAVGGASVASAQSCDVPAAQGAISSAREGLESRFLGLRPRNDNSNLIWGI